LGKKEGLGAALAKKQFALCSFHAINVTTLQKKGEFLTFQIVRQKSHVKIF
jgi:hypothetical protein